MTQNDFSKLCRWNKEGFRQGTKDWIKLDLYGIEVIVFQDGCTFFNRPEDQKQYHQYAGRHISEMIDLLYYAQKERRRNAPHRHSNTVGRK